ncbi:glycosyltransferase [Pontibacter pudoricolor]|uniref:glycosyltransferase n=1 Tax=Pontibacter pudoricolor TaxID=2694930 RepID=UPI001391A278|nr:glycosyltransferase [Pontibacter pudoricolor]
MQPASHKSLNPLVTVIIPCYNHALYLHKAIKSVINQTYNNIEIIVVDDGSTDNTQTVATSYHAVTYVYQQNQGLSAARNTGIKKSNGSYLVFLDADDWLYPKGIEINVGYMQANNDVAFISGTFDAIYIQENKIREGVVEVNSDHYCRLLQCNYIGMIATVLFQRWVFDEFSYDVTLKNCEDYDLFLKIARKYKIYHHLNKIAAYRIHTSNMSTNIPDMLNGVLRIQQRQKEHLLDEKEIKAFKAGRRIWKNYYCNELYRNLLHRKEPPAKAELETLLKNKPAYYIKYNIVANTTKLKTAAKAMAPDYSLRWLHKLGVYKKYVPKIRKVNLGDLDRTTPFSTEFGYDRGGPIDRYYIENFLELEQENIKDRVLEIGDNEYTLCFGRERVSQSDILHVDASNPNATFIGDISNAPDIPDNLFDCIILTQTLHLIYDVQGALRTCHRILKPGGTLLLTVPGITPIDHGQWKDIWYWSFTAQAMRKLLQDTFSGAITVNSYGNVLAATSFLYGLGLPEISKEKLIPNDPHYQVIISVKATKKDIS